MRIVCLSLLLAIVHTAAAEPIAPPPALEWSPLAWDLTTDQARAALDKAKMAPKEDDLRRYMAMDKDHPFVEHTTEPGWSFAPRKGWHGNVRFEWSTSAQRYSMHQITLSSEPLAAGALKDELAALTSTYGAPTTPRANQHVWKRDGDQIVAVWNLDPTTRLSVLYVTLSHVL